MKKFKLRDYLEIIGSIIIFCLFVYLTFCVFDVISENTAPGNQLNEWNIFRFFLK